jgi:DNA mismatch repair protein MutL
MGKIIELSQHVSNQIAAGEVVERPCSVVKELVENALDAGAKNIEVRIKDGGLNYLVVQDDGFGMDQEDVEKAIKRYATSKISNAHDLQSLTSFGFRGEALPSIASISRMTIISRLRGESHATKAIIDAGTIADVSRAGALPGTRMEVRDLFFNVPARLKFIKSQRAEAAAIDKLLRSFAFVYPGVAWKFFNDEKLIFSSTNSDDPSLDRAKSLLGKDTEGLLYLFEDSTELLRVSGAICAPLLTRNDGRAINIFVNRRVVNDRKLSGAIKAAFRTLLEVGQNPICAINIDIAPEEVDVNVHPRKAEVRFVDERRVFSHIIRKLGDFLSQTPWLKAYEMSTPLPQVYRSESFGVADAQARAGMDFLMRDERPSQEVFGSIYRRADSEPINSSEPKRLLPAKKFADLRVIGQVCRTYLLCESEEGLVLLDQHAAHERVTFEYLRSQKKRGVASSPLLIPLTVELDAHDMLLATAHLDDFLGFGMEVETFGESSLIIRALPDFMGSVDGAALIRDIISEFLLLGRATSIDKIHDQVCATLACHGSIRAGQSMSNDQIKALLIDLDKIEYAAHCPHGRPIIKSFHNSEMKKWFDRP